MLTQTYEVRIVSRPGEMSGIWRIPDANPNARNYYLIVEAVDAGGNVLTLPVRSEEDGEIKQVSRWGQRVPEAVFRRGAPRQSRMTGSSRAVSLASNPPVGSRPTTPCRSPTGR